MSECRSFQLNYGNCANITSQRVVLLERLARRTTSGEESG